MHILVPLLTCLFVYLKLAGDIAWSWLWVLSPMWISFTIYLVFAVAIYYLAYRSCYPSDKRSKY